MDGKITVLIADDHTILREGLRAVLEKEPDIVVVGEASSGPEAVDRSLSLAPNVVIMDIAMPEFNGLVAARKVIEHQPDTNVIILSMSADEEFVGQAVQNGVRGYLLKETASRELVTAIREVARGNPYFSAPVLDLIVEIQRSLSADSAAGKDPLTYLEKEILRYLADGKTNLEIAAILDIGEKTVAKRRQGIMDKLNIHNIIQLTRYAVEKGIVK
jgi:DNA-binding NarL/FixJ family response regulator